MRRRVLLGIAAVLGLSVALWVAAVVGALGYEPLRVVGDADAADRPWRGAVHVHTELSHDATGSLEEIAAAASMAGLDYIVVADHIRAEGIAGRVEGGWYGDVLVVVGEELSTGDGHLLALGTGPHPYALGPTGAQAIADVRELGGAPLIAHPLGGEAPWTGGWAGAAGIEAWSLSSVVYAAGTADRLRALAGYPVDRAWAALQLVDGPPPALERWRQRVRLWPGARRLTAVGSVDAHGPPPGLRWLGMPSHRDAFETLSTVVWLDEAPQPDPERHRVQAARLVEALVAGRSALVLSALGTIPGLQVRAEAADGGAAALPGEEAAWERGPWTIRAVAGAPGAYRILLLRDGRRVATADGAALHHRVDEPGTYHVEIHRTDVAVDAPWIVVNPFYVWPRQALAAARFQPVPPLPAPPASRTLLDAPGWNPESHPAASSTVALADPGLRWDLGLPREPGDSVYAALSWRPRRPLDVSSRGGLVVRLRSERPWKVAVRLAFGDGEEVWERVVWSRPGGRAEGIPWSVFRPLAGPGTDPAGIGTPTLEGLVRLSLVVTQERVRPGTEASVDVLEVGLYGGA